MHKLTNANSFTADVSALAKSILWSQEHRMRNKSQRNPPLRDMQQTTDCTVRKNAFLLHSRCIWSRTGIFEAVCSWWSLYCARENENFCVAFGIWRPHSSIGSQMLSCCRQGRNLEIVCRAELWRGLPWKSGSRSTFTPRLFE